MMAVVRLDGKALSLVANWGERPSQYFHEQICQLQSEAIETSNGRTMFRQGKYSTLLQIMVTKFIRGDG